ncbi:MULTISPECIES: hypothetical protein [Streptomyces]|uniref:hypothetical protein n=1 Tax=Streptomyces TaxID=1883 RepID=UPI001558F014|nr:hypothetical protein [Streptomyces kasugaensis]WSK10371.1 hypothetical protein OG717_00565 [Streptomyces celluloflavus]WSK17195.1 hypothetical protein OG717_38910 [Streptomyces celluloflavus]
MAEQTAKQHPKQRDAFTVSAPFHPRLGDLALDLTKGGRVGVVVALPDSNTASYHLRPPGGGEDWTAPKDGTTLRPASVPVTHVQPLKRDFIYDHRAQQAALPVQIHHEDGGTSESLLVLTPGQVELYHIQLEQLIKSREQAKERQR